MLATNSLDTTPNYAESVSRYRPADRQHIAHLLYS